MLQVIGHAPRFVCDFGPGKRLDHTLPHRLGEANLVGRRGLPVVKPLQGKPTRWTAHVKHVLVGRRLQGLQRSWLAGE